MSNEQCPTQPLRFAEEEWKGIAHYSLLIAHYYLTAPSSFTAFLKVSSCI